MTDHGLQLDANVRQEYEARHRHLLQKRDHERKMRMIQDVLTVAVMTIEVSMQTSLLLTPVRKRRWWWFR